MLFSFLEIMKTTNTLHNPVEHWPDFQQSAIRIKNCGKWVQTRKCQICVVGRSTLLRVCCSESAHGPHFYSYASTAENPAHVLPAKLRRCNTVIFLKLPGKMLQVFVATGSSHISNRHLRLKQKLSGMLNPSFNNIFVQ